MDQRRQGDAGGIVVGVAGRCGHVETKGFGPRRAGMLGIMMAA